jgi:3-hydroxyacyl-[acyl-carrier-protein] dehydratase
MKLKPLMDMQKILDLLPHRYPFLLVDRVLEINIPENSKDYVGSSIVALKNVTMNEPFFQGHFPGMPIMPGVLLIEAMAQASGLLASSKPNPSGKPRNFFIMGIEEAKFRKTVTPGDRLIFKCLVLKDRGSVFVFKCVAEVDDEVVAEAQVMAKMFN